MYRCLKCQCKMHEIGEAMQHTQQGHRVVPSREIETDAATWDAHLQGDYL